MHIDFTHPYDHELRLKSLQHAEQQGTAVVSQGAYGCIQGPRLPTLAELKKYRRDGVDVIGMTGMPEAGARARSGLPYAHLCGVIGIAGVNGQADNSPDFRSRQTHQAIETIRRLLVGL